MPYNYPKLIRLSATTVSRPKVKRFGLESFVLAPRDPVSLNPSVTLPGPPANRPFFLSGGAQGGDAWSAILEFDLTHLETWHYVFDACVDIQLDTLVGVESRPESFIVNLRCGEHPSGCVVSAARMVVTSAAAFVKAVVKLVVLTILLPFRLIKAALSGGGDTRQK
jgi:hypothetical protein